ncbi:MAG: 2-oxoacid:ferredoxin oxidoreductase subunit beta [Acidobacteriota bacterium]
MKRGEDIRVSGSVERVNRAGLGISAYRGGKTTLCAGCGHNAISERVVEVFFDLGIDPARVAKFSGIGCSSKSPAYFLGRSFAFNGVHGRMPAVATGALLANRHLLGLGVSGDGDTASIGMGQFVHLLRRNVPLIYLIEDNGCYGLTKGQFSATADEGSRAKSGVANDLPAIDVCALAIELGATFVARSFSGDKKQLSAILKAATSHRGTALIDVISPCVTFNDHEGSTKSYSFVKEHDEPVSELDYVPYFQEIDVDYAPGDAIQVRLHDQSEIRLRKLDQSYDPRSRQAALNLLLEYRRRQEIPTGLFFVDPDSTDFLARLNMVEAPLAALSVHQLRPSEQALTEIMEEFE